jgi:guanylate kinase
VNAVGLLFVISGPSGVGKNTLVNRMLERDTTLIQMPTATTRSPRPNEMNGREHFFISRQRFDQHLQAGDFLEWQMIHGNMYGTLRQTVEEFIGQGRTCIADIDVKGALNLKQTRPDGVVLVFLFPPTLDVLKQRILQRGEIPDEELSMRVGRAAEEITYARLFDHQIINDELDVAADHLDALISEERSRRSRGHINPAPALSSKRRASKPGRVQSD